MAWYPQNVKRQTTIIQIEKLIKWKFYFILAYTNEISMQIILLAFWELLGNLTQLNGTAFDWIQNKVENAVQSLSINVAL